MEAMEWCRLNGHRNWRVVSPGLFPGIKDPQTTIKQAPGWNDSGFNNYHKIAICDHTRVKFLVCVKYVG